VRLLGWRPNSLANKWDCVVLLGGRPALDHSSLLPVVLGVLLTVTMLLVSGYQSWVAGGRGC
jgi:hypothetical protein